MFSPAAVKSWQVKVCSDLTFHAHQISDVNKKYSSWIYSVLVKLIFRPYCIITDLNWHKVGTDLVFLVNLLEMGSLIIRRCHNFLSAPWAGKATVTVGSLVCFYLSRPVLSYKAAQFCHYLTNNFGWLEEATAHMNKFMQVDGWV